ncbi:GIY-YIG nuclease family protein [Candidatus Daviesbacteria bacterium]|nr:GIY-YIG nuclease family protein [Candidatus Daviesbacteria bacterium]
MWFVYILLCEDRSLRKPGFRKLSLYTGYSNNVRQRFQDHKNGKGGHYTRSHKPLKLIYSEQLLTQSEALKREKQIKGWGREKKIKILGLELS